MAAPRVRKGVTTLLLGKGDAGEENVRLLKKDGVYRDGSGLSLQVTNGGEGKSWLLRYTFNKKPETMSLGTYRKGVTLDLARQRANEAQGWLWEGKDPKEERKKKKQKEEIEAGKPYLVWHFIDMYLENVVKFLEPKNQPAAERACNEIIRPTIGDRRIIDVTPKIIAYETGLRDKWGPQRPTAKNLHRYLQGVFGQAGASWAIDKNPTEMRYLKPFLSREKYRAKPRNAISFEHVPRFLALLRTMRSEGRYPTQALILEMLIFAGVRPEEPIRARWKEIDPEMTVWTVPKANLKSKEIDRPLPITAPMRNVLIQMQARRVDPLDNEALIFPPPRSPDGRGNEINGTVVSAVTRTMMREMGWDSNLPVVPSGFRFTLSDWADAQRRSHPDVAFKWDEALVERQQDRVPKEKTQVAIRYTALVRAEAEDRSLKDRRLMMEDYGKCCDPAAYTA